MYKIQLLVGRQSLIKNPIRIRIDLAPWIQVRIDVKSGSGSELKPLRRLHYRNHCEDCIIGKQR
jgi:hypothetical protein